MSTIPPPRSPSLSAKSQPTRSPSTSSHSRRPSLPVSADMLQKSPRAVPVPVPQRQGSIVSSHGPARSSLDFGPSSPRNRHGRSMGGSLSGSMMLGPSLLAGGLSDSLGRSASLRQDVRPRVVPEDERDDWLDARAADIEASEVKIVSASMGMEEAVDVCHPLVSLRCMMLTATKDTAQRGLFLLDRRSVSRVLQLLRREHPSGAFLTWQYADLNTFLLLVLQASSKTPQVSRSPSKSLSSRPQTTTESLAEYAIVEEPLQGRGYMDVRSIDIVKRLRRNDKVCVGDVCDISQKDPYHEFPESTTLRTLLPLFASGLHRIAIIGSRLRVLTESALIEHLLSVPSDRLPSAFHLPVTSASLNLPLHPLISLPGTASVLDAMQVMSLDGLTVLGVLSGAGHVRRESSSGSSASSGSSVSRSPAQRPITASPSIIPALSPSIEAANPMEELLSVVTARECAALVVPSEGKQVLGMGLGRMVKAMQVVEQHGRERGEDRVPVHTISGQTTLLRACHLLLATSSSRVFLRRSTVTPPLSPTPSLTTSASSPPSSPSVSSLNLSDLSVYPSSQRHTTTLPPPPATQLSQHFVISTSDIFSALARRYQDKLTPPANVPTESPGLSVRHDWDMDPQGMGKRRRASSAASLDAGSGPGFESWRWAARVEH